MPPQPATYSTTTNKVVIGQVSKEGSTTIQVEGWDAIQAAIYRKEDPPRERLEKVQGERNREIEREIDHCKTKKCKPTEAIAPRPTRGRT